VPFSVGVIAGERDCCADRELANSFASIDIIIIIITRIIAATTTKVVVRGRC